jgi:hypothetical protein
MPRPKKFTEEMVSRFLPGMFARIAAVLRPGEDRADLVREAVEREVKRRERAAASTEPTNDESAGSPRRAAGADRDPAGSRRA